MSLFVEDLAHQYVIGALVWRVADDLGVDVQMTWRNARGGHGRVVKGFGQYLRDLDQQGPPRPSFVVVAADANCRGYAKRAKELGGTEALVEVVRAIPDPHIERWLLLDGAAFKAVFGRGCDAPDLKCERNRYKQHLVEAIRATGTVPVLGGLEYAEVLVAHMDLDRAMRADSSLDHFVSDLRRALGMRQ